MASRLRLGGQRHRKRSPNGVRIEVRTPPETVPEAAPVQKGPTCDPTHYLLCISHIAEFRNPHFSLPRGTKILLKTVFQKNVATNTQKSAEMDPTWGQKGGSGPPRAPQNPPKIDAKWTLRPPGRPRTRPNLDFCEFGSIVCGFWEEFREKKGHNSVLFFTYFCSPSAGRVQ